jgi:hypothetical protein
MPMDRLVDLLTLSVQGIGALWLVLGALAVAALGALGWFAFGRRGPRRD